jgi:hypothetical protein
MLSEPATRIRPSFAATRRRSRSRDLVGRRRQPTPSGSATYGWPRTRRSPATSAGDRETGHRRRRLRRGCSGAARTAQEPSSSLPCRGKNPIVFNGLALLTSGREGRAWHRLVASGCLLTSLWWSLPAAAVETGLGALVGGDRRAEAVSGSRSRRSPPPARIAFQTRRHLGDFRRPRFVIDRIPRRC